MIKKKGRTWRCRRKSKIQKQVNLSDSPDLIALWKWMKIFSYHGNNLKPAIFTETGRGLMITTPLKINDVIISIPKPLLITTQTALESEIGECIKSCSPHLTPLQALCLFLMYEKCKGSQSAWYPYIKVLPEVFTTPAYFSRQDRANLPSCLRSQAEQQIATVTYAYEKIKAVLVTMETKYAFCHGLLTYEEFRWAWFVINTRSVYMKQKPCEFLQPVVNTYALAPLLDLLNHSSTVEVDAAYNSSTQCYEVRTCTTYKKYDQVFICYGPHDNAKLLLEYGFLTPNNPHSVVSFNIDDLTKCMESHTGVHQFNDALLQRKLHILYSNHLTSDLSCGLEGLSWRLTTVLRILCMDFNELNTWKMILTGDECSKQTDHLSKQLAVDIIAEVLSRNHVILQTSKSLPATRHSQLITSLCMERQLIMETVLESMQL